MHGVVRREWIGTHISYGGGEKVDKVFVGQTHCTGPVDLDDVMTHSNSTSLSYGATSERSDLKCGNLLSISNPFVF